MLFYTLAVLGQSSTNPFDLEYKESDAPQTITTENIQQDSLNTSASVPFIEEKPINPFDISNEKTVVATPSRINLPDNTIIKKGPTDKRTGFLFWVFFGLLLIFSSIYGISKVRLGQVYNSFLNENFLRQSHRYNQGNFSVVYLLLYILAIINFAVLLYLIANYFGANLPNDFFFLLKLIGIVLALFGGKHLVLSLVGAIFPVNKEISLYSFTIMIFGILLGMLVFILNIIIAYGPESIVKLSVYSALGAIIAIYLFRTIRGLSIGSKYLVLHKFHFFIYLCTVEILPVVILIKVIRNYLEIF